MINKFWFWVGVLIGILSLLFGSSGVSAAATGSTSSTSCDPSLITSESNACTQATGFMTFVDPETGQQLAVFCENGMIDAIAMIDGEQSYIVGAPAGTRCSMMTSEFTPVINVDPRGGKWVIAPSINAQVDTVYACNRGGMTYVFAYLYQPASGRKVEMQWQPGGCRPGAMPG